jgi:hypothetical protein
MTRLITTHRRRLRVMRGFKGASDRVCLIRHPAILPQALPH